MKEQEVTPPRTGGQWSDRLASWKGESILPRTLVTGL